MKRILLQQHVAGMIAATLVIPSVYFLSAAFMNEVLGFNRPWSVIEPIFEQPENKNLGLNINLLILFGPIASFIISILQVIKIEIVKEKDRFRINGIITYKSYHWLIIAACLACAGSLFLYFIAENCNCH